MPYDAKSKFATNVMSISKKPSKVLYYKSTSEYFISKMNAMQFMSSNRIPAVFYFSISYHIKVINMLIRAGVRNYGCGFAHYGMGKKSVRMKSVTIIRMASTSIGDQVVVVFSKSTYIEPFGPRGR